jgi:hypothetical protein
MLLRRDDLVLTMKVEEVKKRDRVVKRGFEEHACPYW